MSLAFGALQASNAAAAEEIVSTTQEIRELYRQSRLAREEMAAAEKRVVELASRITNAEARVRTEGRSCSSQGFAWINKNYVHFIWRP